MSDWNGWIGKRRSTTAWIDPAQANRMAVTLDREPVFDLGDELPHAWHWLYFHDTVPASRLGRDGHPALGVTMPPVPLPRRMWAGGEFTFHAPLRLGETARHTTTIKAIDEKHGRTGPLYFVSVEHEVDVEGHRRISELRTIVYREMPAGPTHVERPSAPENPDFVNSWTLSSTALFRYSALTFNGHRIHYDVDYAREVEGYPDLVIHGPLLATLLLELASQHERPLHHFRYRGKSPLFIPQSFVVAGRRAGQATALWAQTPDGRLAMEAEARPGDTTIS